MPERGIEPPRIAPLVPKTSASTNFATPACTIYSIFNYLLFNKNRRDAPLALFSISLSLDNENFLLHKNRIKNESVHFLFPTTSASTNLPAGRQVSPPRHAQFIQFSRPFYQKTNKITNNILFIVLRGL